MDLFAMSLRSRSSFSAQKALIAVLAEIHEALLSLSDSENTTLSTMVVQTFDLLAVIENSSVSLWLSDV
jgi:hypothetical protein